MKKLILNLTFLLGSLCNSAALGQTKTYLFSPEQSTVVQSGGFAGIYETYSVKGSFTLTVDFTTAVASFDKVDAILSEGPFLYTQNLGVLFNMTELVGTVISNTQIKFMGKTADFHPVDVHLMVTLKGSSVEITGGTLPPCCDFFIYELKAVAFECPITYYVNGVNGDDNNDGKSPQTAFATIQKGIDTAIDGDTIIVYPAVYTENINFLGKNITLTALKQHFASIARNTAAIEGIVQFRGTENPKCTLTGFDIDGYILGFDWDIDPNGINHTHATISHCTLENFWTGCGQLIYACDGTISNCVIANIGYMCLRPAPVPAIVGCHGLIKNCTMANMHDGIEIFQGRTCTIENSIIYRSSPIILPDGATLNISYCNFVGDHHRIWGHGTVNWGPGNINTEPCFARMGDWQVEGDFHLKSQAGRWNPNTHDWVLDDVTSPCIDTANPGCPIGSEPTPNGNRKNMGAYGGTVRASKSPPYWQSIADLTNDWIVNANDLKVLVDYWLESGLCIPGDLNRSHSVNFRDFALLARDWEQKLNRPPVADAGPDITVLINGHGPSCCVCLDIRPVGFVTMDGSNSNDPDGDKLTFTWKAPILWSILGSGCYDDVIEAAHPTGQFPVGSTTVHLTVSDGELSDTDSLIVTVITP